MSVEPNQKPVIISSIPNALFYEGQQEGIIPIDSNLFSDPGDTFIMYPTKCIESSSNVMTVILD